MTIVPMMLFLSLLLLFGFLECDRYITYVSHSTQYRECPTEITKNKPPNLRLIKGDKE